MASTSPPPPLPRAKSEPNQVTIISHSNLFYWWPVWVVGFVMAIITYFDGYVMAVLPAKGVAAAVNADREDRDAYRERRRAKNPATRNAQ